MHPLSLGSRRDAALDLARLTHARAQATPGFRTLDAPPQLSVARG